MVSDVPKLPQYRVEYSVVSTSPVPKKKDNPFSKPAHEPESFGGLFVGNGGTTITASDISPSFSPEIPDYPTYIPESGPLPTVEMEKQHKGSEMELAKEIKPLT